VRDFIGFLVVGLGYSDVKIVKIRVAELGGVGAAAWKGRLGRLHVETYEGCGARVVGGRGAG
jgi:hypothetical protein